MRLLIQLSFKLIIFFIVESSMTSILIITHCTIELNVNSLKLLMFGKFLSLENISRTCFKTINCLFGKRTAMYFVFCQVLTETELNNKDIDTLNDYIRLKFQNMKMKTGRVFLLFRWFLMNTTSLSYIVYTPTLCAVSAEALWSSSALQCISPTESRE